MRALKILILLFAGASLPPPTGAEQIPLDARARFHPVISAHGMVVSQEAIASQVGADILALGGNAVDAAVATGFALAVTLPQAGNLGGGGFMMIYLAAEQRTIALDYREMAPGRAHRELFLDEQGNVDNARARFSPLSSGVPGTVAGFAHAQQKYGSLPLATVLAPAIRLADAGIRVTYPLAHSLQRAAPQLRKSPASTQYFLRADGSPLQPGQLWRQTDLAWSLREIARDGERAFYRGAIAARIVAEMERSGGLISAADLAAYRAVERAPVLGSYRGYRIAAMPPPSSGGIHLVEMLNVLEGWNLTTLGHNSADYLHRLIETMRRAYADRSEHLGDPDFHAVPMATLTSKDYAASLRAGIDPDRATPSTAIRPLRETPPESTETTHFSVWDSAGNVVSNTYTINLAYGSGIAVTGAGFLLNNEMDDFSSKPGVPNAYGLVGGEANAIAGRKRPLSSMTPALVFKDGVPVLALGSPGGSTIITVVLQTLLNVVDFGMNIAEATAAPRIHHQWQPDQVFWENGIGADTITNLRARGHEFGKAPMALGRTQSIASDGQYRFGASDPRWPEGAAVAEQPYLRAAGER